MKAKKKPLEELELDDLDLEEDDVEAKTKTIEIYLPAKKEAGKVLARRTYLIKLKELSSIITHRSKSNLIEFKYLTEQRVIK